MILPLHSATECADGTRWIGQEEIPFIRAIRFVPNAMKEKLPGEYRAALDTSVYNSYLLYDLQVLI